MADNMNTGFHIPDPRRVTVFVGAYGSGKSEVSVNFALWRALTGRVILADLDTINPFYRSADAADSLQAAGVRLIKPVFANTNIDVPSFGGEVFAVFDEKDAGAVLDIGGEDMGARVLASLKPRFRMDETAVYMVVNLQRPFTSTPELIAGVAHQLAEASGLPLSGLVDNTNLLSYHDPDMLVGSLAAAREGGRLAGVPVVFRAAMDEAVPDGWVSRLPDGTPLLRMRRTIHYAFG